MKAFEKIIGYESVKNELYQIIDMFKNKEKYEKMGAKLPKGVLIYGAPGLGKSMLANALIKECNVKSFVIKKDKDDKESIDEISVTFAKAAQAGTAIILIDDIDKFSEIESEDVDDVAFVAMQAGIDSVKDKNILVVATANNYFRLPESLRRSGRFDRKIEILTPTKDDAKKIIEYYMKSKCVSPDLNFEDISKMISYTSCADLEKILNESAIYATYQRKDKIEMDDIVKAYMRNYCDAPDENYQCSEEEIEAIAIHEAGHAVVAEIIKPGSVGFINVNVTGRDCTGGSTRMCDDVKRMPEQIVIALGGKSAVELFHEGKCGSGCQNDLEKAMSLLKDHISFNGTCGVGMLQVPYFDLLGISDTYRFQIETVVKAELEHYSYMAKDILIKNKEFYFKLVEELKTKHILLYSDIKRIRSSVQTTQVSIP